MFVAPLTGIQLAEFAAGAYVVSTENPIPAIGLLDVATMPAMQLAHWHWIPPNSIFGLNKAGTLLIIIGELLGVLS